ncbi:MAG: hypothetical protein IPO08_19000 [Xanthomonadales bacterium]|nr:hypothetical protein [Xanthomonadales bacterium]
MSKQQPGKRLSYYLPAPVASILAIGEVDSASGRISHMITLAEMLINEAVPALSVGEWTAIADTLNGHWPSYEQGPRAVFGGAWHSVHDSAPELDAKYEISCRELAHKLMAMPLAEQAAVFEICAKRFWSRPDVLNASGSYTDVFRALGAKIAD